MSDSGSGRALLEPPIDPIDGWREIARYVSALTGFTISVDSIKRWSQREHDPLPIRKWGVHRPRVVADGQELAAWCDRQWTDTKRGGRRAPRF